MYTYIILLTCTRRCSSCQCCTCTTFSTFPSSPPLSPSSPHGPLPRFLPSSSQGSTHKSHISSCTLLPREARTWSERVYGCACVCVCVCRGRTWRKRASRKRCTRSSLADVREESFEYTRASCSLSQIVTVRWWLMEACVYDSLRHVFMTHGGMCLWLMEACVYDSWRHVFITLWVTWRL